MSLSINANCALTYWLSRSARAIGVWEEAHDKQLLALAKSKVLPRWAYGPDGMAHVIATGHSIRHRCLGLCTRTIASELPEGSFVITHDGFVAPSPECCFLLLANDLVLPELVKAGMLLCSPIAFDDDGNLCDRGFFLTKASKIAEYLQKIHGVHGLKKARLALRFVTDGAASPPEIDTTLLLCLPKLRGGYGCAGVKNNGEVALSPDASRLLGYPVVYCDLLWESKKCAGEYTSEMHHSGYRKQVKDEMRRAALESMGYRVFFIMTPQLYSQVAFEGACRPLLQALGRPMPTKTPKFIQAQHELRRVLLHEPSWIVERAIRH